MVEILYKKIEEFQCYHRGEKPNAIYLGSKELYDLLGAPSIKQYLQDIDYDNMKFMGIEVIKVAKESYFKIGIVE